MTHTAALEILVVDDSPVVRQALRAMIEADPSFRVLEAADPYEAVAVMSGTKPSAIVLDVDMPRMDGLTFLRKLMRQHPMPVILVTDHVERGLTALEFGALEVIGKPDWNHPGGLASWGARLRESLRAATKVAPARGEAPLPGTRHSADVILPHRPYHPRAVRGDLLIVIGASTGGVQAVPSLLAGLPRDVPGVVIVQHMPAGFTSAFAERMNRDSKVAVEVREASANESVRRGVALVVPGHAHGVVMRSGTGYRVELADGPPVSRHRPSVDVLFRSTAQAAGPRAAGVLLTGMLDDGAQGLREMLDAGGWTIAQDEATSVVFGMPREAIRRKAARQVLPLERIAPALQGWASKG